MVGVGWPLPAQCSDLDQSPAGLHLSVSRPVNVCILRRVLKVYALLVYTSISYTLLTLVKYIWFSATHLYKCESRFPTCAGRWLGPDSDQATPILLNTCFSFKLNFLGPRFFGTPDFLGL